MPRGVYPRKQLVSGVGINDMPNLTKANRVYQTWAGMLARVGKHKNYIDCTVDSEWFSLKAFSEWDSANYVDGLCLDKDILLAGNKIYGPNTCAYVPQAINKLLSTRAKSRTVLPIGVTMLAGGAVTEGGKVRLKPYKASCNDGSGSPIWLGYYNTPEQAHEAWQIEKVRQIELSVSAYAQTNYFNTKVADSLIQRAWKLMLETKMKLITTSL